MEEEVDAGLKLFSQILRTNDLQLREARPLAGRMAFYVVIGADSKQTDIVLSWEFLSDLSKTADRQVTAHAYAKCMSKRMQNPSAHDFYCKRGVPIRVEIEWPLEPIPNRAASFLHISVHNLRETGTVARCAVIITHEQDAFDLNRNPFLRHQAILNTLRRAVDEQRITFFPPAERPGQLQEIILNAQLRAGTPESAIDSFISGKVYWLGFNVGDKTTKVYIADEWDADYLGIDCATLKRTAQILDAQGTIALDSTQEFAAIGKALLVRAGSSDPDSAPEVSVRFDPLLQIRDRGQFEQDLTSLTGAGFKTRQPISLLMIDPDLFKKVNDTYGHPTGDKVLQKAASVLKSICESKCHCYRYGGDEMVALLPNHTVDEAAALAERIRNEICRTDFEIVKERLTVSIGVASHPETTIDPGLLLENADRAMYEAKKGGRNKVCKAPTIASDSQERSVEPEPEAERLLQAEFTGGRYVVYLSGHGDSPFVSIHATLRIYNRRASSTTIFCESFKVKLDGVVDDFALPEIKHLGAQRSALHAQQELQVGANSTVNISLYSSKHYPEDLPEPYLASKNVRLLVLLKETFGNSEEVAGELECSQIVRQ